MAIAEQELEIYRDFSFKIKKSRALYAKCIGRNSRLYIPIIIDIIDFVHSKIKGKNGRKASRGGRR